MKKRLALLLAGVLAVSSLTACGGAGGNNDAAAKVKLGLGAKVSFSESYSVGEDHYGAPAEATNAQTDIHVAAVTLDAEGKILSCQIDAIQVKATVDATGAITSEETSFVSKAEKKEDYGMKGASPIGKEWYEQVDAYELWCVGKTVDEVKAGVGADEYPADDALKTGCTIKIGDITAAVVDACGKAVDTDATSADTLGISIIGVVNKPANAADNDGNGSFQAYVNFATVAQNAEGKISAVLIDSIQANLTWGADGVLTTDAAQDVRTKYTKQGDYGMAGASSLENGEWFQQIDAFKLTILGMTADEVAAIAVDGDGYPTDETLRTGCTMKVADYKTVVVKALGK